MLYKCFLNVHRREMTMKTGRAHTHTNSYNINLGAAPMVNIKNFTLASKIGGTPSTCPRALHTSPMRMLSEWSGFIKHNGY